MPLYNVNTQSALERSQKSLSEAAQAAYGMTKKGTHTEIEKTIGGGATAAVGGAAAGAVVGAEIGSVGGPWGAVIGAVVGLGAYLLS